MHPSTEQLLHSRLQLTQRPPFPAIEEEGQEHVPKTGSKTKEAEQDILLQVPLTKVKPLEQVVHAVLVEAHERQFKTEEEQPEDTQLLLRRLNPGMQLVQTEGDEQILQLTSA